MESGAVFLSLFLFGVVLFGGAFHYGSLAVFEEELSLVAATYTYDSAGNLINTSNDADDLLTLTPPEEGLYINYSTTTVNDTLNDSSTHIDPAGTIYDSAGNEVNEDVESQAEISVLEEDIFATTTEHRDSDSSDLQKTINTDTRSTTTLSGADSASVTNEIKRESVTDKESLPPVRDAENKTIQTSTLAPETALELDAILTDIERNWTFDDSVITDIEFDDDIFALFDERTEPVDIRRVVVEHRESDFDFLYHEEDENIRELIELMKDEVLGEQTLFEKREQVHLRHDSDGDGVTDYDEITIFRTNPFNTHTVNPSSDLDEMTDGEKVRLGIDPTSIDARRIPFENPRTSPSPTVPEYVVESLTVTGTSTSPLLQEEVASKLTFTGRGLPNSFVTLYIFSTPVIVTVQTNEEGVWEYELDRELPDGEHEIFVATVDSSGKILAKSDAIPFVKQANAAALGTSLATIETETGVRNSFVIIIVAVSVIAIILMILAVGRNAGRRVTEEEGTTDV